MHQGPHRPTCCPSATAHRLRLCTSPIGDQVEIGAVTPRLEFTSFGSVVGAAADVCPLLPTCTAGPDADAGLILSAG